MSQALDNDLNLTGTLHRATAPLGIFRQRNFSCLWTSMTLVGMGNQMEQVVLGWYVLTLTDSPFLVGLVGSARMALNFLALFTGAIADRVPRQRLLAAVEFSLAVLGTGMLVLIVTDRLEVWHILRHNTVGRGHTVVSNAGGPVHGGRYPERGPHFQRRRADQHGTEPDHGGRASDRGHFVPEAGSGRGPSWW